MKKPSEKDMKELIQTIRQFVGMYDILINWRDWSGDGMTSMCAEPSPKYLSLDIKIDFKEQDKIDQFFSDLIHECCHYYTSSPASVLDKDTPLAKNLLLSMGEITLMNLLNQMGLVEEQLTTMLERKFFADFKKTPGYPKYKKLFSKYF